MLSREEMLWNWAANPESVREWGKLGSEMQRALLTHTIRMEVCRGRVTRVCTPYDVVVSAARCQMGSCVKENLHLAFEDWIERYMNGEV